MSVFIMCNMIAARIIFGSPIRRFGSRGSSFSFGVETFFLLSRLSTTLHIEFVLPPILNMDLPNPDYSGNPKIDDEAPVPWKTLADPTTGHSTLIYSNPCNCDDCCRQFRNLKDQEDKEEFAYGTSLSPVKAQEDIQARVRKINEGRTYLREYLRRMGIQ
jgi:hypothetical protein